MIIEKMENGVYTMHNEDELLLTITDMGNNVYRSVNMECDITAEVIPIDEYTTNIKCLEYKRRGRDGKYRKTTTMFSHNLKWLSYILEETGFLRKSKPIN